MPRILASGWWGAGVCFECRLHGVAWGVWGETVTCPESGVGGVQRCALLPGGAFLFATL